MVTTPVMAQKKVSSKPISAEVCSTAIEQGMMEVAIACENVLRQADDHMDAQRVHISDLTQLATTQEELLNEQNSKIDSLTVDNRSWFQKAIVIGVLGVLAGAATMNLYSR